MNFKLLLIIPLSLLLIPCHSYGQKNENVEFSKRNFKDNPDGFQNALDSIAAGDSYYKQGPSLSYLAIPYYLGAQKFNPDNDMLNYKIGVCMLSPRSPFKTDALPYLQKAFALNPYVADDIHYLLGRAYHLNMDWAKAKLEYNSYLQSPGGNKNGDVYSSVKKKIEECNTGEKLVKKPVNVKITNMGPNINTEYPDYEPLISADESVLIFTSDRPGTTGGKMDMSAGEYYADLYISYYKDSAWTEAQNMGEPINTPDHDATAGLSPDGQTLYIYRGTNNGDIYESHLKGETWTNPQKMGGKINSPDQETTVSIGPDGKTLYFVSDRPGGFGGKDIYKSVNNKGSWSDPLNLGMNINTRYDEEGVTIQADGKTLYFSSQGHNTMGGFDIFKSVFNRGKWTNPENLGYPINSPDDDLFFVISANGKHAYFSSVRKGGYGEKDIYMITFIQEKKDSATPKITLIKGIITDSVTHKPIEASIEIVDNKKNEVIASFLSNSSTGKFLVSLPGGVNYGIAVKAENYLFYSANFNVSDTAKYSEVFSKIALQPLNVGSSIVLHNIFFETNSSTLSGESTAELDRLIGLLKTSPTLKIEISGYTDNVGAADYNKSLSESRAKSVVDYLVAHGIPSSRLSYKGYGKENPIASNDNEEGRKQNRRTEFKIIGK